jgi:plastocyanin
VGDVVRWEFQDGAVVHNVDGKGSLPDFFSGNPQSSGAYQYTFRTAGTYHYHCDVHPTMTGTVIVS